MIRKHGMPALAMLLWCFLPMQAQVTPELQARWNKESSVPQNPLIYHRPGSLPDRVILVPQSSDGKAPAVVWRTDTTVTEGVVEFIEADSLTFPKANRQRINASYSVVRHKDYPMHFHKAVIGNMRPGARYKYRVGHSPHWSPWYSYKAETYTDTIRLLYFGDTQNGIFNHATRIYKDALRKFGNANLALHVGDLINHANNDYEWGEWHRATADINSLIPILATPGNHEYLKNMEGKKVKLSDYWTSQFPHPYPPGAAGQYFIDYGFVRFIVLNSNERIDEQGAWLDSVLSQTARQWVVLVSHHPVFSGAAKRVNKGLIAHWLPVIEKHRDKIGLVLQGHDHTYARGGLKTRTGTKNKPSQPVFAVTVVGDKYYELNKQSWMDVCYANTSSYQYIEITPQKIVYKAFSETDVLIDDFELTKPE